ncbi:hypothetical protein ACF0H5_013245 [Mactra antiquata]
MRTKARYSELHVNNVTVKVGEKTLLDNISANAYSGDLLAVLGPTGAGKTTLLNVITGKLKPCNGDVTLNGQTFSKRLRRRLAFVQQQDLFFSQLTLWQTLYFTAQLRLPDTLSESDKLQKINDIIDTLDIRKCINTVIGDVFVRGLSGGEKKRASIACELLTDPDILLMDEPTSGLDSSTALSIMQQMKMYAQHYNKTIITTIHQPSSQIYHMFNNILLLVEGHGAYFGPTTEALPFFENVGLVCQPHFNPADFILQVAKSDEETISKILAASKDLRYHERNRKFIDHYSNKSKPSSEYTDGVKINGSAVKDKTVNDDVAGDIIKSGGANGNEHKEDTKILLEKVEDNVAESLIPDNDQEVLETKMTNARWVTSWWTQYYMLSWRSLNQTKGVLLQGYAIVQTLIVSLVVGILYWQIEMSYDSLRDVMGLLFFSVTYWTFHPAFEAISTYPVEKGVIAKERAAGTYRLSAYYFAKMTSELPLTFMLPTVMYTTFFLMSGIGGVAEYFMTFSIILVQILVAQAFGFLVGVAFNGEIKPAFTTFVSYSLCAFMLGGFFTQRIPPWLRWAKYLSTMLYPFGAVCNIIFKQYPPTFCNNTAVADLPQCLNNSTDIIVTYKDVLYNAGLQLPLANYIFPAFILIVGFRVIGYFVLKYRRPKLL